MTGEVTITRQAVRDHQTPDDLLDPAKLPDAPDDFKLLDTQFKLPPNEAVYLLLIWHWRRVQGADDNRG